VVAAMPAAVGRVAGRNPLLCIALVCPHPPTEPAATGATWATLQLVGLLSHLTGTLAADPLSGQGQGAVMFHPRTADLAIADVQTALVHGAFGDHADEAAVLLLINFGHWLLHCSPPT